jgi:hypothetical protein
MMTSTFERVPAHTSAAVNEAIRLDALQSIARVSGQSFNEIEQRLDELSSEWDIERALEANASTLMLLSLGLGTLVDRRWFAFSSVIAAFLLRHAIQGWCPPVPILRRLGFRTSQEIDAERFAIKFARGDFSGQSPSGVFENLVPH